MPDLSVVGPGVPAFADAEPRAGPVADAEPEPVVRTFKSHCRAQGSDPM